MTDFIGRSGEVEHRCLEGENDYPNDDWDKTGTVSVNPLHWSHWMANAKEAMDADAAEEKDTTVEIGIEKKAYKFTKGFSEMPVILVSVVVDQKG